MFRGHIKIAMHVRERHDPGYKTPNEKGSLFVNGDIIEKCIFNCLEKPDLIFKLTKKKCV